MEIAKTAVELASRPDQVGQLSSPKKHVGYYLVDAGLFELEAAFGYQLRLGERLRRWCLRHATLTYLGTLALLTIAILALLIVEMLRAGADWLLLATSFVLGLIPASDLALSILNWDVTHLFAPRLLPKMDTAAGVPSDARTMVVIPTILSDEQGVRELLERLEVHYLANQDDHIYFALLGDFADADAQELPIDATILEEALGGIEELNKRYRKDSPVPRFHLFHRQRLWNAREQKWMGWERKRGKLHEFNRVLRGALDTSFIVQTAKQAWLTQVRFVITLDSDSQLPRDAAR